MPNEAKKRIGARHPTHFSQTTPDQGEGGRGRLRIFRKKAETIAPENIATIKTRSEESITRKPKTLRKLEIENTKKKMPKKSEIK